MSDNSYHIYLTISGILGSGTAFTILAHAVQSFPTPKNEYWAWFLGVLQFAVGQRERADNTWNNLDTKTVGIQRGHQDGK